MPNRQTIVKYAPLTKEFNAWKTPCPCRRERNREAIRRCRSFGRRRSSTADTEADTLCKLFIVNFVAAKEKWKSFFHLPIAIIWSNVLVVGLSF